MRKLFFGCALLLASLSLSACGGSKIAVIDPNRIYQESEAGIAALAHLDAVQQDVQKKAEFAQEYAVKASRNKEVAVSLQRFFLAAQESMAQTQQATINTMQELVQASITTYREQHKITAIFPKESLIGMDPTIDVTSQVIELMNRTPVTFAPVQVEDFVPPASAKKK